jgi:hypothetical protein
MDIAHVELLRCLGIDILKPKRGMSKKQVVLQVLEAGGQIIRETNTTETKEQLAGLIDFGYTKDDLDNKFTSVTNHTIQKLQVG